MLSIGKTLKISGFNNDRKSSMRFDSYKAFKLVNFFLIVILLGKLFDPFVDPVNLCRQIIVFK